MVVAAQYTDEGSNCTEGVDIDVMKGRAILLLGVLILSAAFSPAVLAEGNYSTASLVLLCADANRTSTLACKTYLRGVVDTWILKDIVSIDPPKYDARNGVTFCEAIIEVSDDEWVRIIRQSLSSMPPLFASDAVMKTLSTKLCQ